MSTLFSSKREKKFISTWKTFDLFAWQLSWLMNSNTQSHDSKLFYKQYRLIHWSRVSIWIPRRFFIWIPSEMVSHLINKVKKQQQNFAYSSRCGLLPFWLSIYIKRRPAKARTGPMMDSYPPNPFYTCVWTLLGSNPSSYFERKLL